MSLKKIIGAGILGTSTMTLFSYILSEIKGENFKEPLLLSKLISTPGMEKQTAANLAWIAHYAIGISFAAAYERLIKSQSPDIKEGAATGAMYGIVGILVWEAVLKMHPDPPRNNRKAYYTQLFIAHIIFGITMALYYREQENKN